MTPQSPSGSGAREASAALEAMARQPYRVRRFLEEPVPREDVERLAALATAALSPCSSQAWRLIAVQDPETKAAMRSAILERFDELAARPGLALQERKRLVARAQALLFSKAPLCIAVVALPVASSMEEIIELAALPAEERDRLCAHPDIQSVGAAVQLLTSAAHAMGYGTCWTCAPLVAKERLEELLGVSPPARLVAVVPIGRPAEPPLAVRRPPLDKVLSFR